MSKTGFKRVLTLRKFVGGVSTPSTKTNDKDDQDYVADFYDATCLDAGQTTTSTTAAPTTAAPTTTTTSAQEAVGRIAAVALCTGSDGSCTSTLTRSGTNVVYIKIKDNSTLITNLVKSRQDVGSLRNGKYVFDNTPRNLSFLDGGLSGYIYNRDEGIVDDSSVINSPESIDATTNSGAGDYLISAISILDAGADQSSTSELYYPKNAPLMTLSWNPTESRMSWIVSNCLNIGGNNTVGNEVIGGDGTNYDDLVKGSDGAAQQQ